VAGERERSRCRERLQRLSESSLDGEAIRREAIAELQRVIGFDRWCWPLADPDSLLPLSGLAEHDFGPQLARVLELEFSGKDVGAKHVLARSAVPVSSLSAETAGDLARSPRWDEVLRPVGIGDVAAVACRDPLGCWGWIETYRDSSDASFDPDDLQLLAEIGPSLGSALRRTCIAPPDGGPSKPKLPGVIVLGADLRIVSWTDAARSWIETLPVAALCAAWGMLPAVVYPVATLARSPGSLADAHALERTIDGRWLMIQASPLKGDGDEGSIAVTVRAATPSEIFDVLCRVYALTRRERDVVAALAAGLDTHAISKRLFITQHTIQDHLKSIFEKVGVHSRRELLATFNAT
jgi:DNA-binding CsgD family transcriptional regulator